MELCIDKFVDVDFGEEYKQKKKIVKAIVLRSENVLFGKSRVGEMNFFGKKIFDWCVASVSDYPTSIVRENSDLSLIDNIKNHLGNEDITIVIFDDIPLIQKATVRNLVQEFSQGNKKVQKLPRGYILDTQYAKIVDNIYSNEVSVVLAEDFVCINNLVDYNKALKLMKQRIFNYHTSRGVLIVDFNTVFIDAEVEIGQNVVIEANNHIYGRTVIGENCVLQNGNTVKDSFLGEGCELKGAYIDNAKLEPKTVVEPFVKIVVPRQ